MSNFVKTKTNVELISCRSNKLSNSKICRSMNNFKVKLTKLGFVHKFWPKLILNIGY
jgi:hypothetical protein